MTELVQRAKGRLRCLYGRHEPKVVRGKSLAILFDEPVEFLPPCRYCGKPGGTRSLLKSRDGEGRR